jgi:hypothetical protein
MTFLNDGNASPHNVPLLALLLLLTFALLTIHEMRIVTLDARDVKAHVDVSVHAVDTRSPAIEL